MLIPENKHNNIRQYWLDNSKLFMEKDSHILSNCDLNFNCQSYYPTFLKSESGSFYIYDHPLLLNLEGKKIFQIQVDYGLETVISNQYLCLKRHEENFDLKAFALFEGSKKISESEYLPFDKPFISSGYFIFKHNNHEHLLSSYSIATKKFVWQQNLNELLDSSEVSIYANLLHVIGDKLFLFAYDPNWENYATLCLDINTGELIKRIEMGAYLYKHNDSIYTVNGQFINQLDPETFEIKSVDLSSQLKDNNLIIDGEHSFFFGDKLYFAAKPGDRAIRSVMGVLDLNNHQLLDTNELLINPEQPATNDNRYQIEEIKANDKLVAVNTAGGTLHVFEVEQ